jgi:RNase adaptor protein for sRNA GlmZ degradation
LTTRLLIARHLDRRPEELSRSELQEAGDELDRERGGAWVAEEIAELLGEGAALVVVDAVRNADQLAAVRDVADTLHVHLSADEATLAARYAERTRSNPQLEFPNFEGLRANPTEAQVEELASAADLVIDTGRLSAVQARNALLASVG